MKDDYFGANTCPKACVVGDNEKLYMCRASDVATLEKDTLKIVAQLPAELGNVTYDNMVGKVNGDWVFKLWCVPHGLHVGFEKLHVDKSGAA